MASSTIFKCTSCALRLIVVIHWCPPRHRLPLPYRGTTEHQLRLRPEEQNFFTIGFAVEVSIKNHPIFRRHGHIVRVLHSRLPQLRTRDYKSKTASQWG